MSCMYTHDIEACVYVVRGAPQDSVLGQEAVCPYFAELAETVARVSWL